MRGEKFQVPICSMYGIFINICPKNHPNVGKYTIHGVYGVALSKLFSIIPQIFPWIFRCSRLEGPHGSMGLVGYPWLFPWGTPGTGSMPWTVRSQGAALFRWP